MDDDRPQLDYATPHRRLSLVRWAIVVAVVLALLVILAMWFMLDVPLAKPGQRP